jgi:hypothetical protein
MRIFIISLSIATGMVMAADVPKPVAPTPKINTAEIIAFQAIEGRMKLIRDEHEALTKQLAEVRADACRRALNTPVCEIKPDGTVVKLSPPKDALQ